MKEEELAHLSDEDLVRERKKLQSSQTIHALLIGVFIGIAVYSAAKNGMGFATVLPMFFVYLLVRNRSRSDALEKESRSRRQD
jgi:uncharacterized membrane protein